MWIGVGCIELGELGAAELGAELGATQIVGEASLGSPRGPLSSKKSPSRVSKKASSVDNVQAYGF